MPSQILVKHEDLEVLTHLYLDGTISIYLFLGRMSGKMDDAERYIDFLESCQL
jgi:hypothetical protein